MNSDDPLGNPSAIVKRARAEDGNAVVAAVVDESLPLVAADSNPLVPGNMEGRRIVKVRRGGAPKPTPSAGGPLSSAPSAPASTILPPGGPNVVDMPGNSKISRCTRCKTFVKKGAVHTLAECNARIANKGNRSGGSSGRRSRKFRMTPKRRARLIELIKAGTKGEDISKMANRLQKWIGKREKKLSKGSKRFFVDLLSRFQTVDNKRYQANLKRCGL